MKDIQMTMQNLQNNLQDNLQNISKVPVLPPRVFILEQINNVDITSAFEYGQLCALFKTFRKEGGKYFNIWETEDFQNEIIKKLEELKYNPKVDYILVAGHMTSMVVFAATIISSFDTDYAKFLLWNSKKQKYVVKEL